MPCACIVIFAIGDMDPLIKVRDTKTPERDSLDKDKALAGSLPF